MILFRWGALVPRILTVASTLALVGVSAFDANPSLAASSSQIRGFLVTRFTYAMYFDPDFKKVCPQGAAQDLEERFLETLIPSERKRLSSPENADERAAKMSIYAEGPNGEDMCANPRAFPNFPVINRTVQSRISYGLNLDGTTDGRATPNTCTHQKFAGSNGESGIDNQAFRALGCAIMWRGEKDVEGDQVFFEQSFMEHGSYNYVIEIDGITDMRDDEVMVGIYSVDGTPLADAASHFLPNQTLKVTQNANWHNHIHGRIVNGVLTTDKIEHLRLKHSYPSGAGNGLGRLDEHNFYGTQFRLTLKDDGSLEGVMGGYKTPLELGAYGRYNSKNVTITLKSACASEYNALLALADGYPDPQTGKCTMDSVAFEVRAIPAYLIHPEPTDTTAASK